MQYWLLIIVLLTNIIQGITGFAGTALALPFGIYVTDLETAKAILNVLGLLASIYIFLISYKNVNYYEFFKMTSGMLLGMAFAKVALEGKIDEQTLMLIYAVFVIIISAVLFFFKKGFQTNCWLDFAIIVLSGIIHQLYVSGGTLLVIYAINKIEDKKSFRGTLSLLWIVLNTTLLIDHTSLGYFDTSTIILGLECIIPLALGIAIGQFLFKKCNRELFRNLTCALLMITGVLMLINNVIQ
jgi:uncharacterized membrane protein YfcA